MAASLLVEGGTIRRNDGVCVSQKSHLSLNSFFDGFQAQHSDERRPPSLRGRLAVVQLHGLVGPVLQQNRH
jgi:hypothetical protein